MSKLGKPPAKAPDLSRGRPVTRKAAPAEGPTSRSPDPRPRSRKTDPTPAPKPGRAAGKPGGKTAGRKAKPAGAKADRQKAGSPVEASARQKAGSKDARAGKKSTTRQDALRAPLSNAPPDAASRPPEGPIAGQRASEAHGSHSGSSARAAAGDRVTFKELIADLKTRTADSAGVAVLADCPPLRALVSAWPAALLNRLLDDQDRVAAPASDAPLVDWLRLAWSCVSFDIEVLGKLCGPGIDVRPLVERASGLLLIYPDGTVHPDARRYLNAYAYTAIVKRRKSPGERS